MVKEYIPTLIEGTAVVTHRKNAESCGWYEKASCQFTDEPQSDCGHYPLQLNIGFNIPSRQCDHVAFRHIVSCARYSHRGCKSLNPREISAVRLGSFPGPKITIPQSLIAWLRNYFHLPLPMTRRTRRNTLVKVRVCLVRRV